MKKITLALDEEVVEAALSHARRHQITLDVLVRELFGKNSHRRPPGVGH
jgi:hypothetical protein